MPTVVGPFPPLDPIVRSESLNRTFAGHEGDIWVFAYGSLIWHPGFLVSEARPAVISGYRRSFCVWTAHARGTPENPGLGLGLVRSDGFQCHGIALLVDRNERDAALKSLWDREMWTDIYVPVWRTVNTEAGKLDVVVFEVNKVSQQYAANLSLSNTAQYIASARGHFGSCREYLYQTARSLREYGARDDEIDYLCTLVRQIR